MKRVKIIRSSDDGKETLGDLFLYNENGNEVFKCKTLERPWLNNQHGISCIPLGSYPSVKWSHMQTADKDHYQVMDVPARNSIFIHGGNKFADSHGCILLGYLQGVKDNEGEDEITSSGNAIKTFENIMQQEDFSLEIISISAQA